MSGADLRTCIVIPIYNHKEAIVGTVARLSVHGLPMIVVDDGSDEATQAVLAKLACDYGARMMLRRLPVNGGKGAAVMEGLRAARRAGYTHALQIDADGQHDADDVPRFLAAARAEPHAVILGRPVYDESVPKSRLYGRYVTHAWVWIETLSFTIRDSMCGFRLYPLDAACALIDSTRLGTRMDFDIEILVRLYWRRLAFRAIPTRVVYAADGVSHFDVLWDNVRISASHTRLVCGMLLRLPMLLAHKAMPRRTSGATRAGSGWWRVAERGSRLGMWLLALSCRLFGVRFTGLWLHPVVGYFLLTGSAARAASHRYFAHLEHAAPGERTPRPGWRSAYRQMLAFAQSGLDKLAAWSGRIAADEVMFDEPGPFEALVESGRGALVIGAHLGNLEMTRALAVRNGHAKVTAIVYTEHAKRFNSILSSANGDFAKRLVQVRDFGPETSMMMKERIDAGELLVIVGDRVPAHESGRTTDARFLGATAPFAQGPYVLAHALGCPVFLFFCLKERGPGARYRLYFEPFAERIDLPRRERAQHIAAWAQRYASRLEHYCRKAPYQWFNFFDFWARPGKTTTDGTAHRGTDVRA
ncbi:glycosyl transferase family protein [Caballeronia calidae]|uniref:Glycosyl transferase family protein n=1 Tax=Caballeronia calidae TaxID=1777139 RepID=A0A158CWE5_9BURK|nr:glycosyltransferase family 2 protein [Caballeronia calidae]SAK86663.1 glycosyl transferase family protein [Caballeronia calidae]